ncbi:hypothetical protein R3P38DRAFT_2777004 [Favolaschia claudopus]|uniref:Uncharacterized protein n=1 Tax=Favolaschia claudopus TaxID=2862362 RepID=A0AAW0BP85_9AGAR
MFDVYKAGLGSMPVASSEVRVRTGMEMRDGAAEAGEPTSNKECAKWSNEQQQTGHAASAGTTQWAFAASDSATQWALAASVSTTQWASAASVVQLVHENLTTKKNTSKKKKRPRASGEGQRSEEASASEKAALAKMEGGLGGAPFPPERH